MLIAIDPGIEGCGIAVFSDGKLIRAELGKSRAPSDCHDDLARAEYAALAVMMPFGDVTELVIERPQIYTAGRGKGDPNLLVPLAAIAGAIAVRADAKHVTWLYPRAWKGATPKPKRGESYIIERRVRERLDPFELGNIREAGALSHNVYDAIGIGLHHLGRFAKKRVIAR